MDNNDASLYWNKDVDSAVGDVESDDESVSSEANNISKRMAVCITLFGRVVDTFSQIMYRNKIG
jgi:hypothetical protein